MIGSIKDITYPLSPDVRTVHMNHHVNGWMNTALTVQRCIASISTVGTALSGTVNSTLRSVITIKCILIMP